MIGQQIHNKLITDFAALEFTGTNIKIFQNVRKYYATDTMGARDCLLLPDSNQETVDGQSAGNFQTTREYGFRVIVYEEIEESTTDAAGDIKYSRLLNIQDELLDYLQKEPSNLNSWGQSNGIEIFKIRVRQVRYDTQRTESGYAALLDIPFGVYLNVIPQNL